MGWAFAKNKAPESETRKRVKVGGRFALRGELGDDSFEQVRVIILESQFQPDPSMESILFPRTGVVFSIEPSMIGAHPRSRNLA